MFGPIIETERLILRPPEPSDAKLFVDWFMDPEVVQHLSTSFEDHDIEKQQQFFIDQGESDGCYFWLITDKNNQVIGSTGFHKIVKKNESVTWGIVIADKTKWGCGYGQEVLRAMIRFVFNVLEFNRFELGCFSTNVRGLKCYLSCGFHIEGAKRQALLRNGVYIDEIMMSIVRSDLKGVKF